MTRIYMNQWLELIWSTNSISDLERLYYEGILPWYRAEEWKGICWEQAAVEYHDRTDDNCGFTVILQAAKRWEDLEAAGGLYHAA